jgi:phosphate acetyltransferase/phosphate butyryltransferase
MTSTSPLPTATIRNRPLGTLAVGDGASLLRRLDGRDLRTLAALFTGIDASQDGPALEPAFLDVFGRGLWGGALVAGLLGTDLPGPGLRCRRLQLDYLAPLALGDTLQVSATVTALDEAGGEATLAIDACRGDGEKVFAGQAVVTVPTTPMQFARGALPDLGLVQAEGTMAAPWIARIQALGAVPMAVVHPCSGEALLAALQAAQAGLIEPVLVAPRARLEALAADAGLDLCGLRVEDVPHSHAAAARAVELAARGEVEALMKGSLHTDELMAAVVSASAGLRTKRRISHCFLMQTPAYPRPFIITDAAINIAPDLVQKADIVRNAVDLARVIGVDLPKVAILAAVETVDPAMPATLDAAALCKMAERGQISGALLDGPLAFDNAISAAAARIKGIDSKVAGQADILLVPDLESGNMLAKQLEYLDHAGMAGVVLGARVPIVLTSRADQAPARVASCALAVLLAHHYRSSPP